MYAVLGKFVFQDTPLSLQRGGSLPRCDAAVGPGV